MKTSVWISIFLLLFCIANTAEEYFRSNSIGMPLEAISENETGVYTYYLRVYRNDFEGGVYEKKKVLYKNNEEYGVWIKRFSDNILVQETVTINQKKEVFDLLSGKVVFYSVYTGGDLTEKWKYEYYPEGGLAKREIIFPENDDTEITYVSENNGRLRSQTRKTEDGTDYVLQGISKNQYLQWIGTTQTGTFEDFSDGRLMTSKRIGTEGTETWEYEYGDEGYVRSQKEGKRTVEETFNNENNLVSRIVTENDMRTYYEMRIYDTDGKSILSKTLIEKDERKDWAYSYEDDELSVVEEYTNTRLVSRVTYHKDGYRKDIFQGGSLKYTLEYDSEDFLLSTRVYDEDTAE